MGFFSGIKKAFKSVFGGIMKIFQPILAPIAKALDSKLGKAIMMGLSIFTMGTALLAGGQAFAAGLVGESGSFINAFVQGGKQFMTTLTTGEGFKGADTLAEATGQTMQAAAGQTGQALQTGGAPGIVGQTGADAANMSGSMAMGPGSTGDTMTKAVTGGMPGQSGQGAMLPAAPEAMGPAAGAKTAAEAAAQTGGAVKEGGWLSRAAKAGADFIGTEGGGQVVGSLISAAGNYYTEKDRQEFEDRVRRQWGQGEADAGIRSMRDTEARVGNLQGPSAQGIARTSRTTARTDPAASRPQFMLPVGGT